MDEQIAQRAAKQGAAAAFVSAGVTLLVVVYGVLSGTGGALEIWSEPWNLVDVVLLVGLGFCILRRSRTAAVMLFGYFILAKILFSIESGRHIGIGLGLVFLYFSWRAIRGTFSYHRLRREQDANYRAASKWSYIVGIPTGIVILAVVGFWLMQETGVTPSAEMLVGDEVPARHRALLIKEGILQPDEKIELFYSDGFISILEDGSILTDRRVISYQQHEGDLQIEAIPLDSVVQVTLLLKGDWINPSTVCVRKSGAVGVFLLVPADEDADAEFVNAIMEKLNVAPDERLQQRE